jgi:hypothetical protein
MDIILTGLLNPEDSLINDNNLNDFKTLKFKSEEMELNY